MSDLYASDLYEYLPRTGCCRCGESGCMAFADKLARGQARLSSCAPLRLPEQQAKRQTLEKLLADACNQASA